MERRQIYNLNEVAELLGVHVETVRRAVRNGELRAAAIGAGKGKGAGFRVSRVELARWWRAKGGGELFEDVTVEEAEGQNDADEKGPLQTGAEGR
jgi:excisionase family DNA binding protein